MNALTFFCSSLIMLTLELLLLTSILQIKKGEINEMHIHMQNKPTIIALKSCDTEKKWLSILRGLFLVPWCSHRWSLVLINVVYLPPWPPLSRNTHKTQHHSLADMVSACHLHAFCSSSKSEELWETLNISGDCLTIFLRNFLKKILGNFMKYFHVCHVSEKK